MKEVTPHLTILKKVPRLFIKLSNFGIMLSDANNIHLKQEIHGLHCLPYMYVGTIDLLALPYQIRIQYQNAVHSNLIIYQLIFIYINIMLAN